MVGESYSLERLGRRDRYVKSPLSKRYMVFIAVIFLVVIGLIIYFLFNPLELFEKTQIPVDIPNLPLGCSSLELNPICVYDSISIEVGIDENIEDFDEVRIYLRGSEVYEATESNRDNPYLIEDLKGSVFVYASSVVSDLEMVEVQGVISGNVCGLESAFCEEIIDEEDDSDLESDFS